MPKHVKHELSCHPTQHEADQVWYYWHQSCFRSSKVNICIEDQTIGSTYVCQHLTQVAPKTDNSILYFFSLALGSKPFKNKKPYDDSLVSAINADLIIMAMIWLFGNYLLRSCSSSDDKLLLLLILLYWYSVNILAIIWWLFYVTAHGQVDHVLIIYQYSGNHLMIICCSCWSSNNDHQMVMSW